MKCTPLRLIQTLSAVYILLIVFFGNVMPVMSQGTPSGDRAKAEQLYFEGLDMLKKRNPENLVKFLEAKKADPSYPPPYYALGQIYRSSLNFDTAEKEYLILIRLEPKDAMVHKSLGEIYTQWSDNMLEKAEKEKKTPDLKAIRKTREKAVAELKKADSLKFRDNEDERRNKMEIYKLLGKNLVALGDYQNALEPLDKARQMNEKDGEIRLYTGKALSGKKQYKEAEAELKEARAIGELSMKQAIVNEAQKELDHIKKVSGLPIVLIIKIAAVVVVLIIVILVIKVLVSRKKKNGGSRQSAGQDGEELSGDINSPEDVGKMALRKLQHFLQMPRAIVYLPNDEGTLLEPKAHFGVYSEIENLEFSQSDVSDWVDERNGRPFIFKLERREVAFCRAFPDSGQVLSELEMRVGVPFISAKQFLGIAYFGCEETKDKLKFKKGFEQNLPMLIKISHETAENLLDLVMRKQAITDSLTGIYNEKYFNERLPVMIDEARNNGKMCSLIMIVVDGYREMIDTFGEDHGEKLLKMTSIALASVLGEVNGAVLSRIEDAKFGIICPETSLDMGTVIAERIAEEVATVKVARHIPPAVASIGVGTFPATAIYAEKLLELVSDALEKAQSEGGSKIQVAEKKLRTMETTRMTRDQVLAAVERRRQARKTMQYPGEEPSTFDQPSSAGAGVMGAPLSPVVERPTAGGPAWKAQAPYFEEPVPSPHQKQPLSITFQDDELSAGSPSPTMQRQEEPSFPAGESRQAGRGFERQAVPQTAPKREEPRQAGRGFEQQMAPQAEERRSSPQVSEQFPSSAPLEPIPENDIAPMRGAAGTMSQEGVSMRSAGNQGLLRPISSQENGRAPLPIPAKPKEKPAMLSPFVRRSPKGQSAEGAEGEQADSSMTPQSMTPQSMGPSSGPALSTPRKESFAPAQDGQMRAESHAQEVKKSESGRPELIIPRVAPPSAQIKSRPTVPSGPLDFSKEMNELETQDKPDDRASGASLKNSPKPAQLPINAVGPVSPQSQPPQRKDQSQLAPQTPQKKSPLISGTSQQQPAAQGQPPAVRAQQFAARSPQPSQPSMQPPQPLQQSRPPSGQPPQHLMQQQKKIAAQMPLQRQSAAGTGEQQMKKDPAVPSGQEPASSPAGTTQSPQQTASPPTSGDVAYDPLTGFYQRSSFEQALLSEAQRLSKTPGQCTLLYFGIDGFEQLKTKHGAAKVRKLIKDIAEIIKAQAYQGKNVPARIEENGFALFLPDTHPKIALEFGNRLIGAIAGRNFSDLGEQITISIGMASYPHTVKSFREIILTSRRSMDSAMKNGGSRIEPLLQ
ncbi:MAG: diguanylate cyclase domain-containing protein [Candidatus Xenobiia bacterium LiM19]